ncbi:hypothetical protein EIKCOROL_01667 [Eikenella corrodens ATCC 23834]|uniref:Uncharacterized protein n=1 Tax=Eikenella corrodens ATCC 23834 TaxID=546274 RepID=C0DWB6_EIKCO|nr:hypothetical protein EIKCOROL_01667 [Eikenella corrodens ATCC 23834]
MSPTGNAGSQCPRPALTDRKLCSEGGKCSQKPNGRLPEIPKSRFR